MLPWVKGAEGGLCRKGSWILRLFQAFVSEPHSIKPSLCLRNQDASPSSSTIPPLAFLRLGSIPQGNLHNALSKRSFHRQIKLVSEFTLLVCLGSTYHLFPCAHKLPITYSVVSWCEHHLLMCIWILYGLLRSELTIFRLEFQGPQSSGTFLFHGKSGK